MATRSAARRRHQLSASVTPELAGAFDHRRFDARGMQAQRGGQPADPSPGDE